MTATFSEAMSPLTLTTATFTLKQGAAPVAGTVTYAGVTAIFTPDVALAPNLPYTATITTGAKNLAGYTLASNYTWSFTTYSDGGGGTPADTTAPTVSSTIPANNAAGVAVNSVMTATFSEAMSPLTLTTATFTLKQGITPVAGTVTCVGTTAVFTPAASLAHSTTYTATITTGAKDLAGNALAVNKVWTFTTGVAPDITAPTVSSTIPANNAAGVAVNSVMTATFSEAMSPLTLTTVTFTLKQGATPVAGTVTCVGTTAVFTPAASLAASTTYTATITTGAKDLAGNALAVNKVWTFTTGVAPTDFENFALGGVNGQDGWTSGNFDVSVVSNNYGYPSFGAKSLRISNAITSGSFGDQTFSKSLVNEAGETSADTSAYSGGTRQPYFEAQWDFASTVPGSEQPGLSVAASPDRGDGARMSWVQMQDTPSGLQLNFYDYQRSVSDFVLTPIATGLDRTVPHTVKITMQFIDGPSNDIVKVYLDGLLIHTGTSWEDYFRDFGGGVTHTVDSIMFRVSGTAAPANSGKGFLIDNFSSFTTGAALDITAPTVTTTTPANAAADVSVSANVSVIFSEAMDISTISSSTFILKQGLTPVAGNVTYAGVTATFTPDAALASSTNYTATITTGAKDPAGNALAADYSWSFTTARDYTAWSDQGIVYTAPAGDAYYPSVLYETNGFESASAKYAMWYTDGTGAAFIVTSPDGTSWSAPTTMTGLGGDAHHVQVLYDADRFGLGPLGPKYRIWYWDIDAQLYDISAIATAQSADGVNWVNDTALTQDASAKLVTGAGTGWNRGSYGPIYLIYQPGAANSSADPWSYSYIMYYDGTDGGHEATGLAYSADGLFWKSYSTAPVLPVSASPAWDSNDSVYGTVYRDALGFHFWYSGGVLSPSEGIGYAFSNDGKAWTKNPSYIFHISDAVSYRNQRGYTPAVIDDGTGALKMYYTAKGTVGPKKIGWATLAP